MKSKSNAGRPSSYKEEYLEQAIKLSLLGLTDLEMANFFGVAESTFYLWKKKVPEFSEATTHGKVIADAEVADKLRQRALGYSHEAVKIFNTSEGPIEHRYTEHYPPDTQAASLWLRNRQPDKWRDKQNVEHTGDVAVTIKNYNLEHNPTE